MTPSNVDFDCKMMPASQSFDAVPKLIMSSSLQSFTGESSGGDDCDSLSSSTRSWQQPQKPSQQPQQSSSPRSIFQAYWTSPTSKKESLVEGGSDEDVIERLSRLHLPLADDENDVAAAGEEGGPAAPKKEAARPPRKSSFDDASIEYHAPSAPSPARTAPRRQILPTPPPPTAVSSSLLMPRRQVHNHQRQLLLLQQRSRGYSTTALLLGRPRHPQQSCLRKSRYSCSAIPSDGVDAALPMTGRMHHGLRNDGCGDLRHSQSCDAAAAVGGARAGDQQQQPRSVSFYSHVSVFEFAVPPDQRRGQIGWSNYFA